MRQQPEEMEKMCTWETLSFGRFGPQQVNLLVDQSPPVLPEQILEVEADTEPPPGLVVDPVVAEENDEAPGVENCNDEVPFGTMSCVRVSAAEVVEMR